MIVKCFSYPKRISIFTNYRRWFLFEINVKMSIDFHRMIQHNASWKQKNEELEHRPGRQNPKNNGEIRVEILTKKNQEKRTF